ncbi:hypothetical protein MMC10_006103 [Thelotrema lepadinum]|nr:hypothetical protein [Thelotrema lepadinum]
MDISKIDSQYQHVSTPGLSLLDLPFELRLMIYAMVDEPLVFHRRYRLEGKENPKLMISKDYDKPGSIDATVLTQIPRVCQQLFADIKEVTHGINTYDFIHSNYIFCFPWWGDFWRLPYSQYPGYEKITRARVDYTYEPCLSIYGDKPLALREIFFYHYFTGIGSRRRESGWQPHWECWGRAGWAHETLDRACEKPQREWFDKCNSDRHRTDFFDGSIVRLYLKGDIEDCMEQFP